MKNESEGRGEREGSSMKLGGRKEKARAGGRPKVRGLYMPPPVPPPSSHITPSPHHSITRTRNKFKSQFLALFLRGPCTVDRFACIFFFLACSHRVSRNLFVVPGDSDKFRFAFLATKHTLPAYECTFSSPIALSNHLQAPIKH